MTFEEMTYDQVETYAEALMGYMFDHYGLDSWTDPDRLHVLVNMFRGEYKKYNQLEVQRAVANGCSGLYGLSEFPNIHTIKYWIRMKTA